MARRVNAETIAHVQKWEGLRLIAYPDPGSKDGTPWTVGYGHTSDGFLKVERGTTITLEQAKAALEYDLNETADAVDKLVKVNLTDNQFGALVSFAFNVGIAAFAKSTLLKKVNAGQLDAVPAQLARWVHNDGKKMPGLVNRRAAEAGLWAKGEFVSSRHVAAAPTPQPVLAQVSTAVAAAGAGVMLAAPHLDPGHWLTLAAIVLACVAGGFFLLQHKGAFK